MKKLLLISTMLMSISTYGQTQYDSLNIKYNELKQKQDLLEINIGKFYHQRADGRTLVIIGIALNLVGVVTYSNNDKVVTGFLLVPGNTLMLGGTIYFHLADLKLKKYNRKLHNRSTFEISSN